jgi:hypothetical protein
MHLLFFLWQPSVAAHHSFGREVEVTNLLRAHDLLGILHVEGGEFSLTKLDQVGGI